MALRFRLAIVLLLLSLPVLGGCTADQKDKKEQSVKDTNQTAVQAVQAIQVPLDRARNAAAQEENHTRQVEEQTKK
jgi:hypothetical protein